MSHVQQDALREALVTHIPRITDRKVAIVVARFLQLLGRQKSEDLVNADQVRQGEWSSGYYCAVAVLLRETGSVTTEVRALFAQGGGAERADPEDIELFRQHGLLP